ncbi:hypothetical protein [Micromonospora zamorensis]|uniref:hypothetical protein n=1 Tax=Micromonospora zamorensis TaxID=709883 RepID=UPI0037894CB1
MDRHEILTGLIRQYFDAMGSPASDDLLNRLGASGTEGFALGLVAASALPPWELSQARAGLEPLLEDLDWLERRRATAARPEIAPAIPVNRALEGHEQSRPPRSNATEIPMLLHVQSLAGERLVIDDKPAVLVSLEVWSSSMRLRLAYPSPHLPAADILRSHRPWRAWDDTGTQYRERGSESSDAQGFLVESRVFDAPPPAEATLLSVAAEHAAGNNQFTIPLRRIA